MKQSKHTKEMGSVLFYILIAVALFAALSYTVAQMMRSSHMDAGAEHAGIYADEILARAHGMRESIHIMTIANDCAATDISFEATGLSGYAHTPAADTACQLFHKDGGGEIYQTPPTEINGAQDWIFTGANDGYAVGTQCNAASCADLIAILPGISAAICTQINKKLGIAEANNYAIQEEDSFSITKFQGAYSYADRLSDPSGTYLKGQRQGCVEGKDAPQSSGTYYFYQILIPR